MTSVEKLSKNYGRKLLTVPTSDIISSKNNSEETSEETLHNIKEFWNYRIILEFDKPKLTKNIYFFYLVQFVCK